MRYLLILLLLIGCSSPTEQEPEYVYQINDSIQEYQILNQQSSNQIYLITADGITLDKQSLLHGHIDAYYGHVNESYWLYSGDIQRDIRITVHFKVTSINDAKDLINQRGHS